MNEKATHNLPDETIVGTSRSLKEWKEEHLGLRKHLSDDKCTSKCESNKISGMLLLHSAKSH